MNHSSVQPVEILWLSGPLPFTIDIVDSLTRLCVIARDGYDTVQAETEAIPEMYGY